MIEIQSDDSESAFWLGKDGYALNANGERVRSPISPRYYPTRELALAAKARFEFRAQHPNMPEEWYERNGPGKRETKCPELKCQCGTNFNGRWRFEPLDQRHYGGGYCPKCGCGQGVSYSDKELVAMSEPAPFTPPDHVMFRGERLEHTLYDAAQASEAFHSYTSPNNNGTTVWFSDEYMRGAHNGRMVLDENWHETSLADGFARLQAWLEQDAQEWAAAQVFQVSAPTVDIPVVGSISETMRGLSDHLHDVDPFSLRIPRPGTDHFHGYSSQAAWDAAGQCDLTDAVGVERPKPPTIAPTQPTCTSCNEPCDGIYRLMLKSGVCTNCREAELVKVQPVKDEVARRVGKSTGPKRMAYDEPPRAPISATAKWHCLHTSVDATPGWEE